MGICCICKIDIVGQCLICGNCFKNWPRGKSFSEYCKIPYNPKPIKYPSGYGVAEDYP